MGRRCKNCYLSIGDDDIECPNCGASNPLPKLDTETSVSSPEKAEAIRPMKWFHFLVYFWLFASCAVFLFCALGFVGNAMMRAEEIAGYEERLEAVKQSYYFREDTEAMYAEQISELRTEQTYQIVMAIASGIMGIWALVSRTALAKYDSNGPVAFYSYLVGCIVWFAVYGFVLSGGNGAAFLWWQLFTGIPAAVINGVCLGCSKVYFSKRYKLFY